MHSDLLSILPGIVNFVAMIAVLYFAGRKGMASFLVTRRQTIGQTVVEAEKLAEESGKMLSQWETAMKSAEAHAQSLIDEAKQMIDRFRKSTEERVKTELARIKKEVELVGQSEVLKAKASLQREVVEHSVQAASQYLKTHLTDEDGRRIVTEYVEMVGNGKA